MKKKVLMVYPEIPKTYWGFQYSLPFTFKKAGFPPVGLLTVAAMLPESEFELKLVDMNVTPLREKDVAGCDIVFTSSMLIQKDSLNDVIALCNRLGKPVVAGGPYPTSSREQIRGVDHFVLNEAEVTLPPFLEDLRRGSPKAVYESAEKPDITATPAPRFDLIRMSQYQSMALQYSRGCPFNCEFCDIIELFGRIPRVKSPSQLIAEAESLYRLGHRGSLFIVDDNFIGNRVQVKKLLPELARWQRERNFPFNFLTEASIDLAGDEDLMDGMVAAGFHMVFIGIETPVEASLSETGKKQNVNVRMLDSVRKIQRKGIEVSAGFIVGFDSDPEDIAERQIDFIQKSGIPMAMVGLLTALPQTRLFRRLKGEGRMLEDSSGNNTRDLHLNFRPRRPEERVAESYKSVVTHIYQPKNYFKRCSDLIRNHPHRYPYKTGSISVKNLFSFGHAFLRSLVVQTFSGYGLSYWGCLLRTLFTKPRLIALAFKKAVMGHHFIRMTREQIGRQSTMSDALRSSLENARSGLEKRLDRIRAFGLKEMIADIYRFRKNELARIRKFAVRHAAATGRAPGSAMRELWVSVETAVKDYSERILERLTRPADPAESNGAKKWLQKLRNFQDRVSRDMKYRSGCFLENLEILISDLVHRTDQILKFRLLSADRTPESR